MYTTTSMASFPNRSASTLPFSIFNDENKNPGGASEVKRPTAISQNSNAGMAFGKQDSKMFGNNANAQNRRAFGDLSNLIQRQNTATGKPAVTTQQARTRLRLVANESGAPATDTGAVSRPAARDRAVPAQRSTQSMLNLARPSSSSSTSSAAARPSRQPRLSSSSSLNRSVDSSTNESALLPASTEILEPACGVLPDEFAMRAPSPVEEINDASQPGEVAEYADDIYRHFFNVEATSIASPTYMARQTDINEKMRAVLIDWLVDVHTKFRLLPETLYLAINILDRVLEKNLIARNKLQLVGTTSMLLASKYEEICVPEMRDFIFISANFYSKAEMIKMETFILNSLEFKLTVPTVLSFLKRFVKAAKVEARTECLALYLLEAALLDLQSLRFVPSVLAASALLLAMRSCQNGSWNATVRHHSNYAEAALEPCISHLLAQHRTLAASTLTAVRRKYSSSKYHQVAKIALAAAPADAGVGGVGSGVASAN